MLLWISFNFQDTAGSRKRKRPDQDEFENEAASMPPAGKRRKCAERKNFVFTGTRKGKKPARSGQSSSYHK